MLCLLLVEKKRFNTEFVSFFHLKWLASCCCWSSPPARPTTWTMMDQRAMDISSPVIPFLLSRFVSISKDLVTLSLPPSCRLALKEEYLHMYMLIRLSLFIFHKHAARIVATPGCPTKWVLSSADPHYHNVSWQLKLSGNQVINFFFPFRLT